MPTLGEFLSKVFEWIYQWWPVRIVNDWEQGIRLRHGNITALLNSTNGLFKTGIHFYWPGIGEVIVEETNIKVFETTSQTCTTLDKKNITFTLGVKFRISNLRMLYQKIHDAESTLTEELRSAAGSVMPELQSEGLPKTLGPAVIGRAKERMYGWGVDLIEVDPINLAEAPVVRLIMES